VSHLDRELQLVRRLLLDELDRYVGAGQFPLNHDFSDLQPYFVDAHGTRCAVAHLMEVSGEGELVAAVARSRNNARVRELAHEPGVLAWLAAAGLTVAEAALIQPEYCRTASDCVCGGTWVSPGYPHPADGVLEGVIVEDGATGKAARVEVIYGKTTAKVGDSVRVHVQGGVGTRVLVPVDSHELSPQEHQFGLQAVALQPDGSYVCRVYQEAGPPLTKPQFIAAVESEDCAKMLSALDGAWTKRTECRDNPAGCSTAPTSGPTSLGLLLALVSTLVWRRRSRPPASKSATGHAPSDPAPGGVPVAFP